ncbi:MAG: DUF7019 family protein [Candidatus Udaeobacter sp.]
MKYYLYISGTKVDMLYPQLPPAFLRGAEADFKINLGIVSSGVKAQAVPIP